MADASPAFVHLDDGDDDDGDDDDGDDNDDDASDDDEGADVETEAGSCSLRNPLSQ